MYLALLHNQLMYVSTIVLAKQRVAYLKKMEQEREAMGGEVEGNENYTTVCHMVVTVSL